MTIQSQNSYYAPNSGVGYQNVEIPHVDVRAPTIYDYKFPIGKRWIDESAQASYELCSVSSVGGEMQAVWTSISYDANPTFDSVTVTNGITITAGSLNASSGSTLSCGPVSCSYVTMAGASAKLYITSVGNPTSSIGTATLAAGTATITTSNVTASSKIFLTVASLGTVTAPQAVYVSAITANTSFVITSADATDTSSVNWFIIN